MDDSFANLFFKYVLSDDYLEEIRELLDLGLDPNFQTTGGTAPLHVAALSHENNTKAVRELIKSGAQVDLNNHLSYTALHFAMIYHNRYVVKELLRSGAFVNAKSYQGETPLHLAVRRFRNKNSTLDNADPWIIDYLLSHEDMDSNARDSRGYTPLMVAIEEKQVIAALLLLEKKADSNICNNVCESSLHVAFSLPPTIIEFELLNHGVDISSVDKWGETPLDILIKNGLESRTNKWVKVIFKIIAFKYSITSYLKQKFERVPDLSHFFNECCDEIDYMRSDYISGNITMHDILWNCLDENDFKNLLLQIHKPIVDRLLINIYPVYFMDIVRIIPEFSMFSILEMTACSKKHAKANGKLKDLSDLLSVLDIIYLFLKYLSIVEIFCLIVAFSDVKITESMSNLHELDLIELENVINV